MTKVSKLFTIIGCLLILAAVVLRIALVPIIISERPIQTISLLILANTAFLIALLFKK
jgi:hypothetical protein